MKDKYLISICGIIFEFTSEEELIKLIEQKINEISYYEHQNSLTILQIAYLKNFLNTLTEVRNPRGQFSPNVNALHLQLLKNSLQQH